jgi:hypothetical protein
MKHFELKVLPRIEAQAFGIDTLHSECVKYLQLSNDVYLLNVIFAHANMNQYFREAI